MREMVYGNFRKGEVLYRDNYEGYEYIIISRGTHPTAYIVLDENDKLYGLDYDDIHEKFDVYCHYGLTYSKDHLNFLEYSGKYKCFVKSSIKNKWVIGWDYAHAGDSYGLDGLGGKKWTTLEIVKECREVIIELKEINS